MKDDNNLTLGLLESEREWRRFMIDEIKELKRDIKIVRKNMGALKVRVAVMASLFGGAGSFLIKFMDS